MATTTKTTTTTTLVDPLTLMRFYNSQLRYNTSGGTYANDGSFNYICDISGRKLYKFSSSWVC
jgi:hypothetical protein